jgi:NTP pyrophosphatase (non-canonical NTP hydrolase)
MTDQEKTMGYMQNGLTFRTLRDANKARLPLFRDNKMRKCHSKEDGSDWSPAQWLQAVIGELGEYANMRKKVERGDYTLEDALPNLSDELADVVIYLDILADQLGIDLGKAIMSKWNKTSKKVKANMYIDAEDWHYLRSPMQVACPRCNANAHEVCKEEDGITRCIHGERIGAAHPVE